MKRKGIILAGGNGTRLHPLTLSTSKQLLPIYDKPMIYYPLSTLMLGGIKDILIISKPNDENSFKKLLGDGENFGINISYKIQPKPEGIAQAFLLAESFLDNSPSVLILGDNLFHGDSLVSLLSEADKEFKGASIFAYAVKDPERYGVIEFNEDGIANNIIEKPKNPKSSYAITGIYFYDNTVVNKVKTIKPSERGELEITDINRIYLDEKGLKVKQLGRGITWLDTGTFDALYEASGYIRALEQRQGLKIGCPEEIAWRKGWINNEKLKEIASNSIKSGYGSYLLKLIKE
ncbi:glucose-1-phosphate thymidylyltransferase RfbA [Prochlorococcus sp. MIT 1011]|uniref:glucose-1-phosphate thymidylyltransferase RfbA n=1 Tax=Prochlorococcus sp. MIT 1011 TaxID=3082520 RepID=UPI0039B41A38